MAEHSATADLGEQHRKVSDRLAGLQVSMEDGVCVLHGVRGSSRRRILYVSNYGMAQAWRLWERGVYPGHHLWGCLELAEMGYEVLLPEPASGRGLSKRLRNDWLPSLLAARRLGADDIVYCSHNVLLWTPLFKAVRAVRAKVVGLLYACEPLPFGRFYDGVIAHTPAAGEYAAKVSPRALCAHISWGVDLDFFPVYPYEPEWFLSCGKTMRDLEVISEAFHGIRAGGMIVHPEPATVAPMPPNIEVVPDRGVGEEIYSLLVHRYYRHCAATMLTLTPDPAQRHAAGVTNVLESMACGRPLIVTRTGALAGEIDVDKEGVGLYVNPSDSSSLRQAVTRLAENPGEAREMGLRGRRLCQRHFNMRRFAADLHAFFERL